MEHRLLLEESEVKGLAAAIHPKYRQLNLERPQLELAKVEHADLSSIWITLHQAQRNTDELLKEHRAVRSHYEVW